MSYPSARKAFCVSVLCLVALDASADAGGTGSMVIESFSGCTSNGGVPCGWHPTQNATEMFSIHSENGDHFLRIDTRGGNTTIGKRFGYSPDRFPYLSWRWRAHVLPKGAREDRKRLNDSGAAVYVVFRGTLWLNKIIKYVWSTALQAGTDTESPHNGRVKVVVLQSGSERLGEWITEHVDVYGDYVRLFGGRPPEVEAVAVMSDADNTGSRARADYDDFRVSKHDVASMPLLCPGKSAPDPPDPKGDPRGPRPPAPAPSLEISAAAAHRRP